MKKLLLAIIAAAAAVTMAACGSSAPVKDAVSAATGTSIENMSLTAAAGSYSLTALTVSKGDALTKDSYTENTLTLDESGAFTLKAVAEYSSTDISGTFEVTDAGVLTLDGGKTHLIADGEKIVCDGEKIVASGILGAVNVTMEYTKDGVKPELKADEGQKSEDTADKTDAE